jgi:hypothetical protein
MGNSVGYMYLEGDFDHKYSKRERRKMLAMQRKEEREQEKERQETEKREKIRRKKKINYCQKKISAKKR